MIDVVAEAPAPPTLSFLGNYSMGYGRASVGIVGIGYVWSAAICLGEAYGRLRRCAGPGPCTHGLRFY